MGSSCGRSGPITGRSDLLQNKYIQIEFIFFIILIRVLFDRRSVNTTWHCFIFSVLIPNLVVVFSGIPLENIEKASCLHIQELKSRSLEMDEKQLS